MKIARKMQVYLLHWQHLCIAATSCAALHSKARTERRLTQGHHSVLPDAVHTQCQAHANCGFAVSALGGRDRSNQDEVAFLHSLFINERVGHFGNMLAVGF